MNKYNINTPIGTLQITCDDEYVLSIEKVKSDCTSENLNGTASEVQRQLEEYFNGGRKHFDFKMKIDGTEFQKKVWNELIKIPFGETISYGELALRVGSQKASRAVGNANGKNRFIIVIPCHRVVAKNGLGGYSCGIETKKFLLDLEQNTLSND